MGLDWKSKYLPSRASLESNRWLRPLLARVANRSYLWEFQARRVVVATWVGVYWAMMPMPLQTIAAVLFAILFRANILVAVAWVWLSNPLTMLPILYSSYYLGRLMLAQPLPKLAAPSVQFSELMLNWQQIIAPLAVGSILVGIISATLISALVALLFWFKRK